MLLQTRRDRPEFSTLFCCAVENFPLVPLARKNGRTLFAPTQNQSIFCFVGERRNFCITEIRRHVFIGIAKQKRNSCQSTSSFENQYLSVIRLVAILSSADLDTRAHCRSYNYALKVLTLSSGWLSLYNSVDKCVEVLLELLNTE